MSQEKVFVVVEAVDRPAGAMLVRYQTVERVEPDPEEARLAAVPSVKVRPPGIPDDVWEDVKVQVAAAEALYSRPTPSQVSYRTEEKTAICTKPEEITAAITEAKEQYEEIRKLKKSGARFEFGSQGLPRF